MMVDMMLERDRASRMGCVFGLLVAIALVATAALNIFQVESPVTVPASQPTPPAVIQFDCSDVYAEFRGGEGRVRGRLCTLPDGQQCFTWYQHDYCWQPTEESK